MKKGELKKKLDKLWFILWKDDSFKGWLFSLIFIFVFIMLIFFPLLSLVTGTALPLAIVESCSMYHEGNLISDFDSWFNDNTGKYFQYKIGEKDFQNFIFKNGFNKGDILFIIGTKPEKLEVGDVIIFKANRNTPIIHRIVEIKENDEGKLFSTLGDNNPGQIDFEKEISEDRLVGKAVFKIAPYVGWIKLIFYEHLRPEPERGFCD